ncbi:helix-turn-helix DNA binding domain protein [Arthrobacter phage Vibaki]|uniref:Helix-turn-helix DNA binding domain protein n=1 Tax=Arthrobacter phage Vibaki TaxID=2593333 RepID=A0A514TZ05_9CAUD|nr:endonuclease [Arthrobacter phage Vibaki]QDK01917.1 helix-turn-helix DNA binding domain protein [Arthrobacter phage Vibaki]
MTEEQAAGRSYQRGSDRPAAKLTDDQIVEIRQAYAHGARQRELAEQYGVTQGLISGIVNGHRWRHAAGPLPLTTSEQE